MRHANGISEDRLIPFVPKHMNLPTSEAAALKLTPDELLEAYRLAAQIKRRGDQDTANKVLRAIGSKIVPSPL